MLGILCKPCDRYTPKSIGGSGETRTRDQRIKRSGGSLFAYINIGLAGDQNDCAIECAIAFWYKIRICRPISTFFSVT